MELEALVAQMARQAKAVRALAEGVPDEQARWKPDLDQWSMLEVVHHLLDEEIYDFRARLDIILHHPKQPWPAIDPEGWVTERAYNQQDPADVLARFREERRRSLAWLAALPSPDWRARYEAPFGPITAADMLASWVAHDLLHTRQLIELGYAYTQHFVAPARTDYAGPW
jgi:hypothetical protein